MDDNQVAAASSHDAIMELAQQNEATVRYVYQHAIRGFSANLSPERLAAILADPRVRYVEQDSPVTLVDTQLNPPSWGLDRIDQRALPLDQSYTFNSNGSGVNVYVIDTGIRITHNEFGGRASLDFTSIDDGNGANDCAGHGTHVSGTIGGTTFGVAKNVSLHAVRVLDCGGFGTFEGVIAGVDWVTGNRILPAVANMSLGGGANQALDDAVTASINAGVVYAIAAGNSFGSDACFFSPARTPLAITVGATAINDSRANFSNTGTCLDIFAPGQDITSSWIGSDNDTNTISGTSMATPHVAGAAAIYLSLHPTATPAEVTTALLVAGTQGPVTDPGFGSPNLLLHTRCLGASDSIAPTVSLTAPADGAVVNETVLLSADAADETALDRVEFLIDDQVVGSDASAPFELSWSSRTVPNGQHQVSARAVDTGCNIALSSATITVDNFIDTESPATSITAPAEGDTITGAIEITADASDNVAVQRVDFYRDGNLIGSDEAAPYSISWDSTSSPNGAHALSSIAIDTSGNAGASAAVNVNIDNPGQASYDPTLRAPICATLGSRCDSNSLLIGRASLGPEPNQPNTINNSCADGTGGSFHADESLDRLAITTVDGSDFAPGTTVRIDADVWAFSAGDFLDLYYAQFAPNPNWIFIGTLPVTNSGAQTLSTTYTLPNGSLQAIRGSFRFVGSPAPCTTGFFDDHDDLIFFSQSFGDVTPPTVNITAPAANAIVTGQVLVEVEAIDDNGVTEVQLFDGSELIGVVTAPPYQFVWDTSNTFSGTHTLRAQAFDGAFNVGTANVPVLVDNFPPDFVFVTSPFEGQAVGGSVFIEVFASDDIGVQHVDFYVDGALIGSSEFGPFFFSTIWDSTGAATGVHAISAVAFDFVGNSAPSQSVNVFIDAAPPAVAITSPASGDTVSGNVSVNIDASDDSAVARVDLYVGNVFVGSAFSAPYTISWDTSLTGNGLTTLVAVAFDVVNNFTNSAPVEVLVDNPDQATYDANFGAPRCADFQSRCDTGGLVVGRGPVGPEQNAPNTIGSSCADGIFGSFHFDESLDRIQVVSLDGRDFVVGGRVRIEATVFAYSAFTLDQLDLFYTADANNPSWTYLTTLTPTAFGLQVLSAEYDLPMEGGIQAVRGQFRFLGAPDVCTSGFFDDRDDLIFAVKTPVDVFAALATSIRDTNHDGSPDGFEAGVFTGGVKDLPGQQENRAILEYDVSAYTGTTITRARLVGRIDPYKNFNTGVRSFELATYAGNGAADLSDWNVAGTVVGNVSYAPPADVSAAIDLDVTAAVQAQLSGGANFVGLRVRSASSPNGPNLLAPDTHLVITP